VPPIELPGLSLKPLEVDNEMAKFDLTLSIEETQQGLNAVLQYNTDLFEDATARRMLKHYEVLLEAIVADPDRPVSELPILAQTERRQILEEWNDTGRNYPKGSNLNRLFQDQVERAPEAVAVSFQGAHLSYRELNRQANQMANYLRGLGVGPEAVVAICLPRSLDMVVALLGILKAGGAYLPLDPAYPAQRLNLMLRDSGSQALITESGLAGLFDPFGARVICADRDRAIIGRQDDSQPAIKVTPDNLAYVIYTSGSTGEPKGVEITHSGLLNLIAWHQSAYSVTAKDKATQLAGQSFDASVWELWPYLTAGASIHIPDDAIRSSAERLAEWLAAEQITICFLPTPLAEAILGQESVSNLALRALLTGGDKLHKSPGKQLPFTLVNHYGPTEDTVVTTRFEVNAGNSNGAAPPIGRPISNKQIYILDSHLRPVPIGVPGELYIGGAGLARGYRGRQELTACKFIPNPFSQEPGARLYATGDLVRYLSDGNVEFLGRNDNQVKIRGFRIELGEIEAALGKHPAISEALVIAREDAPGDKRLVAYVVLKPGKTIGPSELRPYLRERLPDYMLPSAFVSLDEMPLTQNGKVDRKRLPKPDRLRRESGESFIAPATELERAIAAVWQDVLQVDRVARHDNFFDMGGHSLLMVQVHSRLQQALNKELSMIELFKFPTVNSLAQHLTRENGGPDVSRRNQERGKARRESIAARERMKQLNQTKESGRRDSTPGSRGSRDPTG
jgi:amino acid adenylation domain-containing protein